MLQTLEGHDMIMRKLLIILAVLFCTGLFSMNAQAEEKNTVESSLTLEEQDVSSNEFEQLLAYLKEKAANGALDTDEELLEAIKEGETRFGVSLTEEDTQTIIAMMNKLEGIGLDSDYLLSQAEKLYDNYGEDIINHVDEAVNEAVSDAVSNAKSSFYQSIKNSVKDFFKNLF